jgi:low temperature requirement protein LtrA
VPESAVATARGPAERSEPGGVEQVRVSTLELFFDLVFVFTITQLTSVLAHHPDGGGLVRVRLPLTAPVGSVAGVGDE